MLYSKTCLKQPLKKKTMIGFQDRLSLNADQKYCRMLRVQVKSIAEYSSEHSAILLNCIKLPFVTKTFVLSIFKWPLKTGFTVLLFLKIFNISTSIAAFCPHERMRNVESQLGLHCLPVYLCKGFQYKND